jgi:MFS family permease
VQARSPRLHVTVTAIPGTSTPVSPTIADENALYRRITWRFVPLLFLCYVFNYMDRTNIGFAQLQMKGDLGFSDVAYGVGAGMLFVSYTLFGLPSNLLMTKVGARKTIFGCLLGWGLCSMSTMFVRTIHQFYVIRFLVGAFEAGFFPGVIFYLGHWFPVHRRGRVIGMFMSATVVAGVMSGLLSGALMSFLGGLHGLRGWQWLFLIEGLPSVILGIVLYFYLENEPEEAKWLTDIDKKFIADALARDLAGASHRHTLLQVLRYWRLYLLGVIFFFPITATYVLAFWQPLLIRDFGVHNLIAISLYTTIPAIAAVVAKIWVPYLSDQKAERRWHYSASVLVGALGLYLTTVWPHSPLLGIIFLALATAGVHASIPVFWAVPGQYLTGTAAASGIAIISMIGTLGGIVGPPALGFIKSATGSYRDGMYLQSALLVLGALLMLATVSDPPELASHDKSSGTN